MGWKNFKPRRLVCPHCGYEGTTPPEKWPSHHAHESRGVAIVEQLCQRLRVPNDYRDLYHGPYSRGDFPPQADELTTPLVNWDADGDGDTDNDDKVDTGTVIGEGFGDMRFYYVYKLQHSSQFIYADWWPWDDDGDPTNANNKDPNMPKKPITCRVGGSWNGKATGDSWVQVPDDITVDPPTSGDFDICYFSLPMAISVKFTFQVGRHRHVYEKLIFLHASRWLKYLNP